MLQLQWYIGGMCMNEKALFTLLHDAWGENCNESMRLTMMRLSVDELATFDAEKLHAVVPEIPKEKWQIWRDYFSKERLALRAQLLEDFDIQILLYIDPTYPESLKNIYRPPSILYVKGHFQLSAINIGMVGSRRATPYGKNVAYTLAKGLSNENICIISGLAKGIDVNSHKGALEGTGGTIAVLGCGINRIYPRENKKMFEEILLHPKSAIVSEWPLDAPATAWHFPARNRIIAGLSDGLVVVEAAKKSGSLISAGYALEYGKEVFAVPGLITSPESVGCHRLIKDGAKLVAQVSDILEEFGQLKLFKEPETVSKNIRSFSVNEQKVYDALSSVPQNVEEICAIAKLPIHIVNSVLLEFELEDIVLQDFGRRYSKIDH